MKILFLSDLHLDENAKMLGISLFPLFCEHIEKVQPDVVIISGDTGNLSELIILYLDKLELHFPKILFYFSSGNHDIASDNDSLKELDILLSRKSFVHNEAINLSEDITLISWSGWYDYSYKRDYHFPKQILSTKKNHWFDGKYVFWGKDDISFYNEQYLILEQLLESNKDKRVIISTHFVPYKDFLTYKENDKHWDICNSFMGAEATGILIDKYPNVEILSFGHTHKRFGMVDFRNKKVICNPLGYKSEWKNSTPDTKEDILNEFLLASTILEV